MGTTRSRLGTVGWPLFAAAIILSVGIDPTIAYGAAPRSPISLAISLPEVVLLNTPISVSCSLSSARLFDSLLLKIETPSQIQVLGPTSTSIDSLPAGLVVVRGFSVIITDTGSFQIAVSARTLPDTDHYVGARDVIYLTAGLGAVAHSKEFSLKRTNETRKAHKLTPEEIQQLPEFPPRGKSHPLPSPQRDTSRIKPWDSSWQQEPAELPKSPMGSVSFNGRLFYRDTLGNNQPARGATVWFYDADPDFNDELLGEPATVGADGWFQSADFSNTDLDEGEGDGTVDVYLVAGATSERVAVLARPTAIARPRR